jgi:hypothetical protein
VENHEQRQCAKEKISSRLLRRGQRRNTRNVRSIVASFAVGRFEAQFFSLRLQQLLQFNLISFFFFLPLLRFFGSKSKSE